MTYGSLGDGLASMFKAMVILLCISVPLGLWKLIELIVWLCSHIKWIG